MNPQDLAVAKRTAKAVEMEREPVRRPEDALVEPRTRVKASARPATEIERLLASLPSASAQVRPTALAEEGVAAALEQTPGEPLVSRERLHLLAQAGRLARETALPRELFYGVARQLQLKVPLNLETFLALDCSKTRQALAHAIRLKIIPARAKEGLEALEARLEQLKLQRGLLVRRELVGRLLKGDTGNAQQAEPLAGYTVRGIATGERGKPRELGYDVTNRQGLFALSYLALRDRGQPNETTRTFRLHVLNPQGTQIHSTTVKIRMGQEQGASRSDGRIPPRERVDVRVPARAIPTPQTTQLRDLTASLGLKLPKSLSRSLARRGIRTLEDLRARGGIKNLGRLPLPHDHPAVRALEAQANLSLLSPDPKERAALGERGYDSPEAVANTPRAEFVTRMHKWLGDFKAAQLHEQARAQTDVLDNVLTGLRADHANGYVPYSSQGGYGPEAAKPAWWFEQLQLAPQKCSCKDCEAAVSPLAYLADLLDYAVTYLKNDNAGVTLSWLTKTFHQPFGDLPASCEEVEKKVRQVRLCIEVLRRYLKAHPPTGTKKTALAEAEQAYRLATYTTLLNKIGTAYDEIRLAQHADEQTRTALADRLGVDLDVNGLDPLEALFLDPTVDPPVLTEKALEGLFGLVDTRRNPLSDGAKLGDGQGQITRWNLEGVEWGRNTDLHGHVYVRLKKPSANAFWIELYRDEQRTKLVASGKRTSSTGSVVVTEKNASHLSGECDLAYSDDTDAIRLVAVPQFLSWRLKRLRALWRRQDWPTDSYSEGALPVIDPDVIGPQDFRNPAPGNSAFDLWQARRTWVDATLATLEADREAHDLEFILKQVLGDPLPDLAMLEKNLTDGIDVETTTQTITALNLTVESFLRLMELKAKDDAAQPIEEAQWDALYRILAQAEKLKQYPAWITQEQASSVRLGPRQFWIALEEPTLTTWLATAETRAVWQQTLLAKSQSPLVDPDLIGPGDLNNPKAGDPAFDLWQARRNWVDARLADLHAAPKNLAGFEASVEEALGVAATELGALAEQEQQGRSIGARLKQLSLPRNAFLALLRIRELLANASPVLDAEWEDVYGILAQARKRREFADWREEERTAGLLLSPDHFKLEEPPPYQVPPVEPEPLPDWRAHWRDRRDWQDNLEARIDQQTTTRHALSEVVSSTEEAVLEKLRDALIMASAVQGLLLEVKAKALADLLLIDTKMSGCHQTTRVAQAIETLQNLAFATRTQQLRDTYPNLELVDEQFDARWEWLGSYATWRAAMFVWIYPENLLHPSLRPWRWQTPACRTLVRESRSRHLTPETVCALARDYSTYFRDVCHLTVEATCLAKTHVRTADCHSSQIEDTGYRKLFYMFARSTLTNAVYVSTHDPLDGTGYAQSFWEPVPELEKVKIQDVIAAVPYERGEAERFLYLFVRLQNDQESIAFMKYDLEHPGWVESVEELEAPPGQSLKAVRAVQRYWINLPPTLVFHTKGDLYIRSLNAEGNGWEEAETATETEDDASSSDAWEAYRLDKADTLNVANLHAVLYTSADYDGVFAFCFTDAKSIFTIGMAVQYSPDSKPELVGQSYWRTFGGSWVGAEIASSEKDFIIFLKQAGATFRQHLDIVQVGPFHSSLSEAVPAIANLDRVIPRYGPWPALADLNAGDFALHVYRLSGAKAGLYRVSGWDALKRARVAPDVEETDSGSGISFAFDITERLSAGQLQQKRETVKAWMTKHLDDLEHPRSNLTYLEEAYDFVAVQLALGLQRSGYYTSALDWWRTVYDYSAPTEDMRKIYYGLKLEEQLPLANAYQREEDWLLDPLNPHPIAASRYKTYTRFTKLAIARCFLDFADAEFTVDTAESLARARLLYLTALELLDCPELKQQLGSCDDLIGTLTIEVGEPQWQGVLSTLMATVSELSTDAKNLEQVIGDVKTALGGNGSWASRFSKADAVITTIRAKRPPMSRVAGLFEARADLTSRAHVALLTQPEIAKAATKAGDLAARDFQQAVSRASGIDAAKLDRVELPWMRKRWDADGAASPGPAADLAKQALPALLSAPSFQFCIPPNPLVKALRLRAEANLFKLRNCRNIAGMLREVDPYAAPTDTISGLPTIGAEGQIVLPGARRLAPTPYRYSALIERAKQLAGLAQHMEAAFLSTIEKAEAERYTVLRARQDVQLARAGVRMQELRVKEADDGVELADRQKQRAKIEVDQYQEWLDEGISDLESASLAFQVAAYGTTLAAAGVAETEFKFSEGVALTAKGFGLIAEIFSQYASFERRREEWEFKKRLAQQDILIGAQQVKVAKDHVRVVGQDRVIAKMQADHTKDTMEYLSNKFTTPELYDWMSGVLEQVYRFLLQQATSVARLSMVQLAYMRQEVPPPFIQADYWEAPREEMIGGDGEGTAPDRRGLTGSARLLQDIYKLDQYAFETDRRKLQLTKTVSLAWLNPVAFQRFRETGVLRFATPMALFDRDFPGHYLRLIHRVRTSVIALIPPTQGIRATLSTTGTARVVIGGDVFQTIVVNAGPQSVVLTSPREATGQFVELADQQPEMLRPFESLPVDTSWEFLMPKASNPIDYRTIADVLLTIEYTALDSWDHRQQLMHQLDTNVSAERPFSFRHQFADQWYDLHNPDQTATPMKVTFQTRREDFPPNLEDLKIRHVALYFARKSDTSFEVPVGSLRLTSQGSPGSVGGGATSIDGIISTRKGNAGSWTAMIGKSPFGEWELVLPSTLEMKDRFKSEQIEDILFVITYSGDTPAWPV